MLSDNYAQLKQKFGSRLSIDFDKRVDQMIQDITRPIDTEDYKRMRLSPQSTPEIIADMINALILSRSIDIVISRRELLNNINGVIWQSNFEDVNTLSPSDVLHSIVAMPCAVQS
jgi:uncharacterized membrane protein (UPF0182 family)